MTHPNMTYLRFERMLATAALVAASLVTALH